MTREIAFIYPLSEELEDRLRVTASLKKGRIVRFVVQYKGEEEKQPLSFQDFKMALTFAIQDLKTSWKWYRMAYEREMENEERAGR